MLFPDVERDDTELSGATAIPAPPVTLALPLTVTGGVVASIAQGSPVEIAQSVALLIDTRPGERRSVPGYGCEDLLGRLEFDPEVIAAAVLSWEPRADPADLSIAATTDGTYTVTVRPSDPSADLTDPTDSTAQGA